MIPTHARPGPRKSAGNAKCRHSADFSKATGFTCDGLDEFCAEKERRATVARMVCCEDIQMLHDDHQPYGS